MGPLGLQGRITERSMLVAAVCSGLVILALLLGAALLIVRQQNALREAEGRHDALAVRFSKLSKDYDELEVNRRDIRLQLTETSNSLGDLKSTLSTAQQKLDQAEADKEAASKVAIATKFFDDFTKSVNTENMNGFKRMKSLEDSYAAWQKKEKTRLTFLETYLADEKSRASTYFSELTGILVRYYPDSGTVLVLPGGTTTDVR